VTDEVQELTAQLQQVRRDLEVTRARLSESEKMASLGMLAAGVAHEINNPVNFVRTSGKALKNLMQDVSELLERYDRLTPDNAGEVLKEIEEFKEEIEYDDLQESFGKLATNIVTGADRMAEIVKSLQTFSRREEEKVSADIHEIIDSALLILHYQYRDVLTINKEYGEVPRVSCFSGKLNQVFVNILKNATDAISEKPDRSAAEEIRIRTSLVEIDEKPYAEIRFSDTGSGIPDEIMRRIFEPFYTTKGVGKGTGLGLGITLNIIEEHGGKIDVTSKMGKGTTFEILLPIDGVL
jgi:two-component system, NtrC family, sensor kinase